MSIRSNRIKEHQTTADWRLGRWAGSEFPANSFSPRLKQPFFSYYRDDRKSTLAKGKNFFQERGLNLRSRDDAGDEVSNYQLERLRVEAENQALFQATLARKTREKEKKPFTVGKDYLGYELPDGAIVLRYFPGGARIQYVKKTFEGVSGYYLANPDNYLYVEPTYPGRELETTEQVTLIGWLDEK